MTTFQGGRGKTAPYQTTHLRIPTPLKPIFEVMMRDYKEACLSGEDLAYIESLRAKIGIIVQSSVPIPEVAPVSGLKPGQAIALENISRWLQGSDRYFRLSGYAGTGKSYLMGYVIKQHKGLKIICASPTNKAAKNLKSILSEQGIKTEATTIAKLLKQLPEINENTGKESFVSDSEPDLSVYDLIIFDEFSMIGKDTFKEIETALDTTKYTKAIFLGDPAQLPPINEEISPIATLNLNYHSTLTEVVRYDGFIGKVAEAIRSESKYQTQIYPFTTSEDKTIICINYQQLDNILKKYFVSNKFSQNTDYIRVLAFKNKTCDFHNTKIRSLIHGDKLRDYNIGDILISKKPLFRLTSDTRYKKQIWKIIINNSEEMKVTGDSSLHKTTIDKISLNYHSVPIVTNDGLQTSIRILTTESKEIFDKYLQDLIKKAKQNKALWSKYYDLVKTFDDVIFAYCLTTHKAQGSSIENVILDIADLNSCQDRQKIIYTALTRAKKRAFILQ